jgi:hypothetical protein
MAGPLLGIYVSIAIPLTAATFALVFRFLARRISKCHLWFDDYFALLSYVCLVSSLDIAIIRGFDIYTDARLPRSLAGDIS